MTSIHSRFQGCMVQPGFHYMERNHATGLDHAKHKLITKSADAGNVVAMRTLGISYRRDWFKVEELDQKAEKYLRQAAEAGDAIAQTELGIMYREGDRVQKNLELAEEWFKKADDQGNVEARINMAEVLYYKSRKILRNAARVSTLARIDSKAKCRSVCDYAKKNKEVELLARASYCLARIQRQVFWDYVENEYLSTHDLATYDRATYVVKKEEDLKKEARQLLHSYRRVARLGHDGARYELGAIHLSGLSTHLDSWQAQHLDQQEGKKIIVPKDDDKAAFWFRKVAESNGNVGGTLDSDGENADFQKRLGWNSRRCMWKVGSRAMIRVRCLNGYLLRSTRRNGGRQRPNQISYMFSV